MQVKRTCMQRTRIDDFLSLSFPTFPIGKIASYVVLGKLEIRDAGLRNPRRKIIQLRVVRKIYVSICKDNSYNRRSR
jgi:hypothetical protein